MFRLKSTTFIPSTGEVWRREGSQAAGGKSSDGWEVERRVGSRAAGRKSSDFHYGDIFLLARTRRSRIFQASFAVISCNPSCWRPPSMSLKVTCPYCQSNHSVKTPKAGKYKPKCSNCGATFLLVVEEGEPIKARTAKIDKVDSPKTGSSQTHDTSVSESASYISRPAVSGMDATIDSATTGMVSGGKSIEETVGETSPAQERTAQSQVGRGVEETIENNDATVASQKSAIDATMEVAPPTKLPKGSAGTESTRPSQQDFSVDQATIESTPSQGAGGSNSSNASKSAAKGSAPLPDRLGGYKIVRELGAGGMGSVYLAKQLSLDRSCALKTIQAQWASNPRVIARFIREAYAAAQLTHHNVVQIYDLGQDRGTNFFSMELVGGGSLDEQIKAKGKLPPKLAATLILQAARGLKFAHDHGMVHRDIKPANLMMTTDGLLKIADLGLVKTPSPDDESLTRNGEEIEKDTQSMMLESARSHVTQVGSSMGTPAYMSPEQAEDAANVDKRADIYSLGCTFYALLTGKPPYEGKTMVEVITKHRVEKLVRPERVIQGLDPKLGDIIETMTAKAPADRYQDLADVINDLEIFLELREGNFVVRSGGDKAPVKSAATEKETVAEVVLPVELAQPIDVAAKRYQESPLLLARRFAPLAWYGLTGLLAAIALVMALLSFFTMVSESAKSLTAAATEAASNLTGGETTATANVQAATAAPSVVAYRSMVSSLKSAIGYSLAGLFAPIAVIIVGGFQGKSPVAKKYRESFIAGGILNWLYWGFAALLALLCVHYLGLWVPVILGLLFGGVAAAAFYFGIETTLQKQRQGALDMALNSLRLLRLRGIDEERIQQSIATRAGRNWEEFFEHLFGYAAKRTMRSKLKTLDREKRATFLPFRDALIDRCDQQAEQVRRAKEEKVLIETEKAELVAKGIPDSEAKKQAEQLALSMVEAATETRVTMQEIASGTLTADAAEAKRKRIKQMLSEARSGKVSKRERTGGSLQFIVSQLLGVKLRFALAALLLVATGMWAQENQTAVEKYWQQARSSVEALKDRAVEGGIGNATGVLSEAADASGNLLAATTETKWKPVVAGLVHERNIIFIAAAGVVLLLGTLLYHWKLSVFVLPVAIVLLVIPFVLG